MLVDLGGKLAPDIDAFFGVSTHALILSSDARALSLWCDHVTAARCRLLASLASTHQRLTSGELDPDARSALTIEALPWTGTLRNLDRDGRSEPYFDAVQAMAVRLSELFLRPPAS